MKVHIFYCVITELVQARTMNEVQDAHQEAGQVTQVHQ